MAEHTILSASTAPRFDAFWSHVSETPRVATTLLDALAHHVERKTNSLQQQAHAFESKWNMSFDDFVVNARAGRVRRTVPAGDVQRDLAHWERTLSLLRHYQSLTVR